MRLRKICENITKERECDDFYHFCLEQTLKNKTFNGIENSEERIYFFSRIAKLNWISAKSPYRQSLKRTDYLELTEMQERIENIEIEIQEDVDMNWVKEELHNMKRGQDWYYARLFELYIEAGASLTEVSKRTTIPINSVSRDIRKVREILKDRRRKKLGL